jgi:hypothetical protein
MTEVTDKLIEDERSRVNTLEAEQKQRIERLLAFTVDSALDYTGSQSTIEDWDNCPEILTKLIIELQAHQKATCDYL